MLSFVSPLLSSQPKYLNSYRGTGSVRNENLLLNESKKILISTHNLGEVFESAPKNSLLRNYVSTNDYNKVLNLVHTSDFEHRMKIKNPSRFLRPDESIEAKRMLKHIKNN